MAVKIRLQRHGKKRQPFYFIVVADSRAPRDGKFIERIGHYNPVSNPPDIIIDLDKSIDWLQKGAIPTKTVRSIMSNEGVMYKKHLLRGVKMGVLSQEEADLKFTAWVKEKSDKLELLKQKVEMEKKNISKEAYDRESKINQERQKKIMEKMQMELKGKEKEIADKDSDGAPQPVSEARDAKVEEEKAADQKSEETTQETPDGKIEESQGSADEIKESDNKE
jgi:small subunit ribosomal protein S16